MTAFSDIGLELWVLVYHLYKRHESKPKESSTVLRELALRTLCICDEEDVEIAKTPSSLRGTRWFRKMSERYSALRSRMQKVFAVTINETQNVARELYPAGCKVEEYADTLLTCAAMLTKPIPSRILSRFTEFRMGELISQSRVTLTADEIASDLIEGPLTDTIIPPRWWEVDEGGDATVHTESVKLCSRPPHMLIMYRWGETLRRRRIHLAGVLQEKGSTAPLAKRLSCTHGALLSEEQFCVYLLRLQGLMQMRVESSDTVQDRKRQAPSPVIPLSPPRDEKNQQHQKEHHISEESNRVVMKSKLSTAVVNKADLGLLYRDPDAALENVDLNDADDVTLQEFKEKMEERFVMNVVRPGDPGYVYDKRVEMRPTERSDWDDSD